MVASVPHLGSLPPRAPSAPKAMGPGGMLWRLADTLRGGSPAASLSASPAPSAASVTAPASSSPLGAMHAGFHGPKSCCRRALHLDPRLASWLSAMAAVHNCGSDNKTLRDLLEFYSGVVGREELHIVLVEEVHEGEGGGEGEAERWLLKPRVTRRHVEWLEKVGEEFGLEVDVVLGRLVCFAMEVLDDDAIFECTPRLPSCTADLYSDCDIFRNVC